MVAQLSDMCTLYLYRYKNIIYVDIKNHVTKCKYLNNYMAIIDYYILKMSDGYSNLCIINSLFLVAIMKNK